jgi:Neutral/alkaline non-lysosomal ceramidase, N-terminal
MTIGAWTTRGMVGLVTLAWACGDSTGAVDETGSSSGSSTTSAAASSSTGVEGLDTSGTSSSTTGDPETTTGGMVEPAPLEAGVAMRYLDRPVGISMAGYGGRTDGLGSPWSGAFFASRGFYALPTIKAMVLRAGDEQLVLLKLPTMSSESGITDAIATKMMERHGVDLRGRIVTSATHSHHIHARYWRIPDQLGEAGIDTFDEELLDLLGTEFADTIMEAMDQLAPAQWAHAEQDDWDTDNHVYRDRRGENNPTYGKDARLTMLAVRRPDGTPLAAIAQFGMHGTILDSDNELLTEDAAGGLEMVFEEQFFAANGEPIFGMFMQAGGGDASPAGDQLGHNGIPRAEIIGHAAAPSLVALYDTLEWRDELVLDVHSQRIELRYATFGYDRTDEFTGSWLGLPQTYEWGGFQCTNDDVPDDEDPATSMEGLPKNCIPVDLLLGGQVPHAQVHQTYLSAARLDDLYLVTLPGEPTFSVINYLREQMAMRDPELTVMGLGYSQDHLLYLTHPDDWFQGGYESMMSLWGPFAARTLVDRQMAVVDELLAETDLPPFVEEAPSLAVPEAFEPRGYEGSDNPGEVVEDVATGMLRTEVVRFRFGGGDPSLGAPRVRLELDPGDGTFVDVPSPAGWAGAALDNSRYHMITHYEPIPAQSEPIMVSRAHEWYVDWEIPADLPAATYRLVASGVAWDGAEQPWEATSSPFAVGQHGGATLDVQRAGTMLTLALTLPPTTVVTDETWPVAGWRVHDPEVGPGQPITVRAPLSLGFTVDGVPQPGSYMAAFDAAAGGHTFDLADAGIDADTAVVLVAAHLEADVDPDAIEAPVP